jgi:hypothetical protein
MTTHSLDDLMLEKRKARRLPDIAPAPPVVVAPKRESLITPALVVLWILMIIVGMLIIIGVLLLSVAFMPDSVQAAPLPVAVAATPKPIMPTATPTPTITPEPTATPAPAMIDVPAQPKWMTDTCLFEIESIVEGEAGIVGGDALGFVAENVLRDAYRLQCIDLSRRWYAASKNGVSDATRAAVISALRDWPTVQWPICDYVIGAGDVRRILANDKTATIGILFTSADHRWSVIGLGCREMGK